MDMFMEPPIKRRGAGSSPGGAGSPFGVLIGRSERGKGFGRREILFRESFGHRHSSQRRQSVVSRRAARPYVDLRNIRRHNMKAFMTAMGVMVLEFSLI